MCYDLSVPVSFPLTGQKKNLEIYRPGFTFGMKIALGDTVPENRLKLTVPIV